MTVQKRARVVIIGAGFGGLFAAENLANKEVDVVLIDRNNYHTFTPLLYQVATASLDPSEIAIPVRSITKRWSNIDFQMGEAVSIDANNQHVGIQADGQVYKLDYDYLILAGGSTTNYFNNQEIAENSHGIKNLSEAIILRNHILKQIERAVWIDDPEYRQASATIVVVGGGPTGIETAGALYELSKQILSEFGDKVKRVALRVILIDAGDRLLKPYPPRLQESTHDQLKSLGVEVVFNDPVVEATREYVRLKSGNMIYTKTLIWAAGVKASPLAEILCVPLLKSGHVPIKPTTEVIGLENIYAVGDMASIQPGNGQRYPMVIQVAKQQGELAAKNIIRRESGEPQQTFKYNDKGSMATIGRNRAVAWLYNKVQLTGFLAWSAWLVMHLVWLIGFRNRLNVFINWVWYYFAQDRSVRMIIEPEDFSKIISSEDSSKTI
jgi:NADH dehydrogenase